MEKIWIWDPGWKKVGSGILENIPDPQNTASGTDKNYARIAADG